MFFVYDENIPYNIVKALKILADFPSNVEVHTIYDLGLLGKSDVELLKELRNIAKDKKCIFITGDKAILRRSPEIESLRTNNLICFICPSSFSNKPGFERALYLLNAWNAIYNISIKSNPKDIYVLPAKKGFTFTENELQKNKYSK